MKLILVSHLQLREDSKWLLNNNLREVSAFLMSTRQKVDKLVFTSYVFFHPHEILLQLYLFGDSYFAFNLTCPYIGWLLKEGHGVISTWAERYFVVNTKTKTLSYYDNSDKKPHNKKGEYAFDDAKCKVEANSSKA